MSEIVNQSLQKMAKGTGIVFVGTIGGLFLAFFGRLLVARYGTESDYGIFSLALVILNVCVVIAMLGLQDGISRSIAFAKGRNECEKIHILISSTIKLSLTMSIILGFVLLLSSDIIANNIFREPNLAQPLNIFAIAIPFFVLLNVLVSIFAGFSHFEAKIYFQELLRNVIFFLFMVAVIYLKLPFVASFYAYLASLSIPCIFFIVYATKRLPLKIRINIKNNFNNVTKELLIFSIPLLGVTMLQFIIIWTDTLMLGYFQNSAQVGLYSAAHPLAQFISMPLGAMLLLYTPITTGLYAKGLISEMRRNFLLLTKWLCSATLPIFLILFLFPEEVLSILFGNNYTSAATVLRILSLGFIINNFLGPNGATLIAMGKSQIMMWATLITAILNICLNLLLIPRFGIEGAASASVISITLINIMRTSLMYSFSGVQPVSRNLIKPLIPYLVFVLLVYFTFINYFTIDIWTISILFILYCLGYGLVLILTKSFDDEDVAILSMIKEKKRG